MSDTVIRVEHLSKLYKIGKLQQRHDTLRDYLVDAVKNLAPGRNQGRISKDHLWALKDVNFEVNQGEVVGIIGKNGAGKSTLLKILSRIMSPTEGRVRLRGRVGSLLEVGTGFHPELTGRENIYLNGAILGMHRAEIERKFDEIVAFSEIEKFLDTPIKRYSSGMYVRLAFAVAAHLEPEILLVDEVLAVGDAAFQKKCLGKMGDVAKEGRTVIFVSHNMDAIVRLCSSSILLELGKIVISDDSQSVVRKYVNNLQNRSSNNWKNSNEIIGKHFRFNKVNIIRHDDFLVECILEYQVFTDTLGAVVAIRIETMLGTPVMTITDNDLDENRFIKKMGVFQSKIILPLNVLAPGSYRLTVSSADMKATRYDFHEGVVSFDVTQLPDIKPSFRREGYLLLPIDWKTQEII